jgi:hypothetical protein
MTLVVLNYVNLTKAVMPKLEGSDCDVWSGTILAFTLNGGRKSRQGLTGERLQADIDYWAFRLRKSSASHLVSMFDRISEERRNCIQRIEKEKGKERIVLKKETMR